MCGIIGYVGQKEVYPILVQGLERLEYRGYDSAGICTSVQGSLQVHKLQGRVQNLKSKTLSGTVGIGHTRWSTHGKPADHNAHPFVDAQHQFAIVHNGIIENYLELKEELRQQGVQFTSETDSEVIVHLIAKHYQGDLKQAVLETIKKLQGAYAFCVLMHDSHEMIGARNGSPLVIGLGEDENFCASDVSALIEHTRKVVYLHDFEVARITSSSVEVATFAGEQCELQIKEIDWNLEQAQKQGYKHFMLKEIFEQPTVVKESLAVYPFSADLQLSRISHLTIVGCGTAYYAAMIGKNLIETLAKIPVTVEMASEFRYKECLLHPEDTIIAISQSGETADTLAAIRLAKKHRVKTIGIINVVDSTIAREVDTVLYTKAGPEIGVASTKAFTAQTVMLYHLAFQLAGKAGKWDDVLIALEKVLTLDSSIKMLAHQYSLYPNFLYIGRYGNYPLALEGALKLKEISYIHAEAYPAGELKHGPISLVSEEMPTVAICPQDSVYDKTFSNIQEIKARSGKVIAIATEGDEKIKLVSDDVIFVPRVDEIFYPLILAIPLQLFAYHIADIKECDVDKPRNLAKSVTVE